jgi:hypothetical protein
VDSVWLWVLLALSYTGTAVCWVRILKSNDIVFFKAAGLVISAIPLAGPFLFLFLDMPPRIPEDAQAKLEWRSGTTPHTQIRRELFQGNRRYIGSLFGVRASDSSPNREYRRALKRKHRHGNDN